MELTENEKRAVDLLKKAFGGVDDEEALEEAVRAISMGAAAAMTEHYSSTARNAAARAQGRKL